MELLKSLAPILIPLVFGTAFFTFILTLVRRFDFRTDTKNNEKRLYEIAYRRADGWGRQHVQLLAPIVLMMKDSNGQPTTPEQEELTSRMLELLCSNLVEFRDGTWKVKEYPDFLAEAHAELQRLKIQEASQQAQPQT